MSKNTENNTVTAETLVAQATEEKLVTPTVPAQATEDAPKKSVDEFDQESVVITNGNSDTVDHTYDNKFRAVIGVGEDIHEFDSVAGLLKHITVRAFKNRKFQLGAGVVASTAVAAWAFTKSKATEVIELESEEIVEEDENLDNSVDA